MRSLAVLALVGALLALPAGCSLGCETTQTIPAPSEPESEELDIEVGRRDYINGVHVPEGESVSVPEKQ